MPRTVQHNKIADAVVIEAAAADNALRAIRMGKGYSVEHLALTCGLATQEIMDIESGKDADPAKLRRIAYALQLPENALVGAPVMPAEQSSIRRVGVAPYRAGLPSLLRSDGLPTTLHRFSRRRAEAQTKASG